MQIQADQKDSRIEIHTDASRQILMALAVEKRSSFRKAIIACEHSRVTPDLQQCS